VDLHEDGNIVAREKNHNIYLVDMFEEYGEGFDTDLQTQYKKDVEKAGIKGSFIDPEDLFEMGLQEVEVFVKKVIASHTKLLFYFKGTSGNHENDPKKFCRTALKKASTTTSMSELTLYYYHYKTVGIPDYESKFLTRMDPIMKGSSNTIADEVSQFKSKTSTTAMAASQAALKDLGATIKDFTDHAKIFQKKCIENMDLEKIDVADKLYEKHMDAMEMLSNVQTGNTRVPLTSE